MGRSWVFFKTLRGGREVPTFRFHWHAEGTLVYGVLEYKSLRRDGAVRRRFRVFWVPGSWDGSNDNRAASGNFLQRGSQGSGASLRQRASGQDAARPCPAGLVHVGTRTD